jgi:DNA-binding NarL/FixJ family response regulator
MTTRKDAGTVSVSPPLEPASIAVAISDPHPLYRRGLATVLEEAGFPTEEPDDMPAWAASRPRPAIVATLQDDADLELVGTLRRTRRDLVLVGLLREDPSTAYQLALSAGADAAVPRDAPLEEILSVFKAALGDRTLLPTDVAREMAEDGGAPSPAPELTEVERALLHALASGDTVSQIADELGFSDRELYRRLRRLYLRLGVDNRSEALVLAARARLI